MSKNIYLDTRQQYPIAHKCSSDAYKQTYLVTNINPDNQPKQEILCMYLLLKELAIFSTPFHNVVSITNNDCQQFTLDYLKKIIKHLKNIYGSAEGQTKTLIFSKIFGNNYKKQHEQLYNSLLHNQKQSDTNLKSIADYIKYKYRLQDIETYEANVIDTFFQLQKRKIESLLITTGPDRYQRLLQRSRQLQSSTFSLTPIPNLSWKQNRFKNPLVITRTLQLPSLNDQKKKVQKQISPQTRRMKIVLNLEQFKNLRVSKHKNKHLEKFVKQVCEQLFEYQFLTGRQYERLSKLTILYSDFGNRFFLSIKPILDEAIGYPHGYQERQNILQYFNEQNACRDCSLQNKILMNGGKMLLLLHYLQSQDYKFKLDVNNMFEPEEWLKGLYEKGGQTQRKKTKNELKKVQDQMQKIKKIKGNQKLRKEMLWSFLQAEKIPICKFIILQYVQISDKNEIGLRRKPNSIFPPTLLDIITTLSLSCQITNLSADRHQEIIFLRWKIIHKLLDINKTSLKVVEKISEQFNPKQFKLINKTILDRIQKQMQIAVIFQRILFWVSSLELKSIIQRQNDNLAMYSQLNKTLSQFAQSSQVIEQKLTELIGKKESRLSELAEFSVVLAKKLLYITHQSLKKKPDKRDEDTKIVYSLIIKKLLLNFQKILYSQMNNQQHEELSKKFKKNFFRYLIKISKGLISFVLCTNSHNIYWSEHIIYGKLKKFIDSTQENPGDFEHLSELIQKQRKDFQQNRNYKDSLIWGDIWPEGQQLQSLKAIEI